MELIIINLILRILVVSSGLIGWMSLVSRLRKIRERQFGMLLIGSSRRCKAIKRPKIRQTKIRRTHQTKN